MTRIATITLYIDVEQFEQDAEETLTPKLLHEIGESVNNEASHIMGYSSWQIGWAEFREDGFVTREFLEAHDYMDDEDTEEDFTRPGSMPIEMRRELVENDVKLNGQRARIVGVKNDFATVRQLPDGLSADFAWITVKHVIEHSNGEFNA
jgi:hypothetical protein